MIKKSHSIKSIIYFFILFIIAFICISPFEFNFPIDQLDPSWSWALSVFSSENLSFGNEVIYNFGPLADIYTKWYNPNSSGIFALMNVFILILLAKMVFDITNNNNSKEKIAICILFALCLISKIADAFYETYCIVFALWGFYKTDNNKNDIRTYIEVVFCSVPLIIFVLMKGTFFFAVAINVFVLMIWMLYRRAYGLLITHGCTLLLTTIFMWVLWKQPILGFLDYVANTIIMSSAYLDGMSVTGANRHIFVYIIFASLFPALIFDKDRKLQSFLLILSTEAFLYLGAKHGFGRHDGHAKLASALLVIVLFSASLFIKQILQRKFVIATFFGIICCAIIGYKNPFNVLNNICAPFNAFWTMAFDRQSLDRQYDESVKYIRDKYSVGDLKGTVDVYNFNNSIAIASSGIYTPRPIFQSYQAFDGYFADINLKHLSNHAPDNILFRVETIDNRYPTLDDGISWPSIFSNYDIIDKESGYLRLKKKDEKFDVKKMDFIGKVNVEFDQKIPVPSDKIIFAKFKFKKTITGRIASLFFKTTNVFINVNLKNGESRSYRLIPRMSETGFYLSPLIDSNEQILQLYSNKIAATNEVESVELKTYSPGIFWDKKLEIEFFSHQPFNINNEHIRDIVKNDAMSAVVHFMHQLKGEVKRILLGHRR